MVSVGVVSSVAGVVGSAVGVVASVAGVVGFVPGSVPSVAGGSVGSVGGTVGSVAGVVGSVGSEDGSVATVDSVVPSLGVVDRVFSAVLWVASVWELPEVPVVPLPESSVQPQTSIANKARLKIRIIFLIFTKSFLGTIVAYAHL